MLDVRIGLAIESQADEKLVEICQKHAGENKPLSKGDFLMAMIMHVPAEVQDVAIAAFKDQRVERRLEQQAAKKKARKEENDKLKKLKELMSPQEIDAILAARQAA
jgi:DUF1365 family protein